MSREPERVFRETLKSYGFQPDTRITQSLCRYYETVIAWNPRLHLTTIIDPERFANRHLGESFEVANRILATIIDVWDIGSGAGVPGVPVALVRPELQVVLVESNRRKAIFLEEATREIGLRNVRVLNERFDPESVPTGCCLVARAVEKMGKVVKSLLASRASQMILLGGDQLRHALPVSGWTVQSTLVRGSEASFIFDLHRAVPRGTS